MHHPLQLPLSQGIGQGPLLPNGVTTKAWAAGISGQPPIDTGATETKETQVLSEVKVQVAWGDG